ncbi:RNA recognition motif domain-containing protein [Motilimonas pumila]|uniref:RNA-binding protein n=1 Tax=Motilimonas pumila TaxID=2303987 RepID=A0A418Y9I1_9GAMM|nr:RNA-binding protein [Motilimonas pumila]RJG37544.1 RNA-binding protein [Motilimonas pumila]
MKSSNTLGLPVLFSFALAGIGFVIAHLTQMDISPLIFAVGIALGGIAVALLPAKTATEDSFTTKTLYVGNLPYRANEVAVRQLFAEHGRVVSVRLMKDKQTGKRRGFGFVEMPDTDAAAAIKALNEKEFQQRTLKVREANERSSNDKQAESNETA